MVRHGFAPKAERYQRAQEYLHLMKRTWASDAPFDFQGRFYRVRGAHSDVRPLQTPHPLIMFGGRVMQGIEPQWHSHASLPKTVIDLLGLGKFGVPRVDAAPSLAGRVDAKLKRSNPPAFGSKIAQPKPPKPAPHPVPPAPWAGPKALALPDLLGNNGKRIPAPRDGLVRAQPPQLPSEAE